ncbi:MAG: DUF4255 domain-containing protein [Prolixibacteraceae bacterium]|jgi:hypothetical protein
MIYPILKFLTGQLNQYIDLVKKTTDAVPSPVVQLESIVNIEENKLKEKNNLLLFMVNLSEEAAMKNHPGYVTHNRDEAVYKNPPLNLNVYIVITAVMTNYENELRYLSHILRFFQGKPVFTPQNSASGIEGLPDNFRIILDLYSLSFEQINYLWSTLGGKQHPFVCYKLRMVEIERESTTSVRGVIRQIRIEDEQ